VVGGGISRPRRLGGSLAGGGISRPRRLGGSLAAAAPDQAARLIPPTCVRSRDARSLRAASGDRVSACQDAAAGAGT